MDCNDVKIGMKVVIGKLGETTGMFIKPRHLDCRKSGVTGTVSGYVPGHGGDVWWVKHDETDEVGAYVFTEMEPAPNDSITGGGKATGGRQMKIWQWLMKPTNINDISYWEILLCVSMIMTGVILALIDGGQRIMEYTQGSAYVSPIELRLQDIEDQQYRIIGKLNAGKGK